MPQGAQRRRAVSLRRSALLAITAGTAGITGVAALTGCSGSSHPNRSASVAPSFSMISEGPSPMPSGTPGAALASLTAGTSSGSAAGTSTGSASGPGPCPLPSPQTLAEAKSASAANGKITFMYLAAQRMCAPGGKVTVVATSHVPTSATVDPNAVVFVLPPGGNGDLLQIPAAAFPAELKTSAQPAYFAITYGAAATSIERISQYTVPRS